MKRSQMIAGLALAAIPPDTACAARNPNPSAALSPLQWRYVVFCDPFHVGVLTSIGAIVVERPDAPRSTVNLPRASPGARGWLSATPPAVPYTVPERRISDTIALAGPDEVTVAANVYPYVVLGVQTPPFDMPIVKMPSFLIRIEPSTLKMETYAMPPGFGGAPVSIFRAVDNLCVVDGRGDFTRIEL